VRLRRVWYPATAATDLGELVTDEESGRTRYVAQLTLGVYAQAVVSLRTVAAESMAARFNRPGPAPDGRAIEPAPEGSREPGGGEA
jgi:hypothetical protein